MRFIDALAIAIGKALAWAFPVIAVMMGFEVVARYAFASPTFWAHEIAGLLAAIAFIFGGAFVMAEKAHMRVTLLVERLTGPFAKVLELFSLLCGAVFLTGLSVAMWGILQRAAFRFGPDGVWSPERSGSSWNTPSPAFLKIALFIGAVLFLLVVVRQMVGLIGGRQNDR
ncbi:MAG: TRAP transporter small permease subunit [Pseudomonadota bacterium]